MRFSGFIVLIYIMLVSFTPKISASKISGSRIAKFCSKPSNQLRFRHAFKIIKNLRGVPFAMVEHQSNRCRFSQFDYAIYELSLI